jgi:hypothetical protein
VLLLVVGDGYQSSYCHKANIELPRLSSSTELVAVAVLLLCRLVTLILESVVLSLVSSAKSEIGPSPTQLACTCTVFIGSKHSSTPVAALRLHANLTGTSTVDRLA